MKKTKELESEETSVSMDKILKIESLEDAKEFERVASGRKFCKRGTRVQDICEEEVDYDTFNNMVQRGYLGKIRYQAIDLAGNTSGYYYQSIKRGEENEAEKEKVDGKEGAGMGVMPDKESAFLALCSDIHTIKNILIFFAVLTVLGLIGGFYTIFVTLQQLL